MCTLENEDEETICSACENERVDDHVLPLVPPAPVYINLLDDDQVREVALTLIMEGIPVTLKVLSGISLEQLVARSLEALEMWTVSQADLEMQVNEDTWHLVTCVEELKLSDSAAVPPHIRVIVKEFHGMNDVEVPFIGVLKKASSSLLVHAGDEFMLERLFKVFHSARTIKGDGNCYYRCVVFRLIEYNATRRFADAEIPLEVVETQLRELAALLADVDGLPDSQRTRVREFFQGLHEQFDADPPLSKMELSTFIRNTINDDSKLDLALTDAARRVIASYILLHSTTPPAESSTDISLTDVVSCNFDGISIDEFLDTVVLPNGRDAEDIIVLLAGEAFAANITVWQRDPLLGISCLAADDVARRANGVVHLLLHGGHYNLLYPKLRGATYSENIMQELSAADSSAAPDHVPEKRTRRSEDVSSASSSPSHDLIPPPPPPQQQHTASFPAAAWVEERDPRIEEIRGVALVSSAYIAHRRLAPAVVEALSETVPSTTGNRKRTLMELDRDLPTYSDQED